MTDPRIAGSVAAFVVEHVGCPPTRVQRVHSFVTNAVYEVEAGGRRLVVKASPMHDALRGEAWACGRGLGAGLPVPAVLGFGRLGGGAEMSAFVMSRIEGSPLAEPHPALRELGARLRRLHEATVPGFGCLADASWDDTGAFSLRHVSWRGFLQDLCDEVRALAGSYAIAGSVADLVAGAIDARGEALAAVEVGSLCHGDLKLGHVLVEDDRLAGVIDWGDAVVADPVWDIARFAHRADASSLALLLEGYDPGGARAEDLAWRIPLYGALWLLVDAIVDHRLGSNIGGSLSAAMESLTSARRLDNAEAIRGVSLMPVPLPLRLRMLMASASYAIRRGWMPAPVELLNRPHGERLARKAMRIACKPGDRSIQTRDVTVEGRGGPIPARVYTRRDLQPGAPAIFFIHGGGFVDGGVDFCDNVQRGLAARTGYVVVGLSYRLAPEHPFPAALEDCEDVLQWMARSKPAGLDPARIAVGGESAGGNLTVALALSSRDRGGPEIAHLSIYYPFTDTSLSSTDWDTMDMPGVSRAAGEFMMRVYAPKDADNPLVNVLHADLEGLPPSTVITCGHDPLRTDGVRLAAALRAVGVPTLHTHYDEMPHGFLMFSRLTKRADESMDEMARETAKLFAAPRT